MIQWPLVLVGGLLGSAHCIGMCGGFAMAIGMDSSRWSRALVRQGVYSIGRICTYATGGAVAGYGGLRLTSELGSLVNIQATLSILAGILLVFQGLLSAGVIRLPRGRFEQTACLAGSMFVPLLASPGLRRVFVAGLLTGFLPCGLVYAYLALATSSGNLLQGAGLMAVFGLGTVPAMVMTGSGGKVLGLATRRKMLRVAAWCVVLTGAISFTRGLGFLQLSGVLAGAPDCPFCP